MNVILSVSDALHQWMGLELAHIPSMGGQLPGAQVLLSDEQSISWQCHVIFPTASLSDGMLVAVEARSHYTVLLPFHEIPSREQLEKTLLQQWIKQVAYMAAKLELIADQDMENLFTQFLQHPITVYWYRNSDPCLAEHLDFAEQSLHHTLQSYRLESLDIDEAISLGLHINHLLEKGQLKTRQRAPESPYDRFLADALYRFGHGLARSRYPGVPAGDFPNPYLSHVHVPTPDGGKVLSMAEYLRNRPR